MDHPNFSALKNAQINKPSGPYAPLRAPDRTPRPPGPLDIEAAAARQVLAETAHLNIHDRDDLLTAAVALDSSLRALVAAYDAERRTAPAPHRGPS
ncbi:hypothetical protein [Streptomyces sp. NPDC047070]|uniref:hypothetical protein n=1 Tax=Streptomyces sp. NPDC047070 TaxID=3154923 RepID=UPI00345563DB